MGPFRMNPEGPLNAADMFGEVMFTLQCLGFQCFHLYHFERIWHMTHVSFRSVSPNLNEFDTPAFCSIAPWVLEATWHAIERRCRLNALHDFHQWGLSASIGSFLWCGGTSFAIHHQIHGICIVETSWLRFPSKFHACLVLVELVDVSLARCFFFGGLLGIPQTYPTKAETQLKKCLILEGSGMVPSRAAGENVRALWLPRVRCGKKGGSIWLPFCASWILRQSFSSLAGKRPLTDWGMKTYFSRPESLPELRRLREHIKWHIWWGRLLEVLKWQILWTCESHGISVKADENG